MPRPCLLIASFSRRLIAPSHSWHCRSVNPFRRRYSSSTSQDETVTLPCKSDGSITLSIHYPSSSRSGTGVVLYLPPGPSHIPATTSAFDDFSELAQSHLSDRISNNAVHEFKDKLSTQFAKALSNNSDCTVVQVNYRLSKTHQFPTPIHDVLTGFDYVASKFLPKNSEIGVCGELAGGSLALMLALTECRAESARIAYAVVHEPIVDWILPSNIADLAATTKKRKTAPKPQSTASVETGSSQGSETQALSLSNLQTLRGMLFHPLKPATYFDPFASPIHFLRTSGATVPRPKGVEDDFATLADLADLTVEDESLVANRLKSSGSVTSTSNNSSNEGDLDAQYEDISGSLDDLETPPSSSPSSSQLQMLSRTIKPRKTRLRYPPPGHSLVIPQIRISAAQNSALIPQLEEFTRLLQRAIVSNSPAADGVKESTITELATAIGRGKEVQEEFGALKEAWSDAEARLRFDVGGQNRLWNVQGAGEDEIAAAARRVGEEFKRMMA